MATIKITRAIGLNKQDAIHYFQTQASTLNPELDLDWQWQGNQAKVTGRGVKGLFTIEEHQVEIEVRLGLLLSAFACKVEREINGFLDKLA